MDVKQLDNEMKTGLSIAGVKYQKTVAHSSYAGGQYHECLVVNARGLQETAYYNNEQIIRILRSN